MLFKKAKTLDDVIEDFLYARQAERYSPATIHTYDKVLHRFSKAIGRDKRFNSIDAGEIRQYLGGMPHLSDKSIVNIHIVLSSLWTWAVDNDYADEHILHKVKKPKYLKKRIEPFSEEEVKRILSTSRYRRDRAVVMVLLDTGMRASELINLTVEDWVDGLLRIKKGKGKKSREVPISKPTEDVLFRYLCKRKIRPEGIDGGDALICNVIGGERMNYYSLRSLMDRIEENSSVPNVFAHRFRHTFAITFLRNGGDIYTLKRILGHSTLTMVQNYLDIVRADVITAHAKASPVVNWQIGGR